MSRAALSRSDQQWQDQGGRGLLAAPLHLKGEHVPQGTGSPYAMSLPPSHQRKDSPALVDQIHLQKNDPGGEKKPVPIHRAVTFL